jgi:hypothetical protein
MPPLIRATIYKQPTKPIMFRNFYDHTAAHIQRELSVNGPATCSDLVARMGMDPTRHKGTIHAIMVDMEEDGILGSVKNDKGRRSDWFTLRDRKRDRVRSFLLRLRPLVDPSV